MELTEGQVVWLAFRYVEHERQSALVERCTVVACGISGDSVVKTDRGNVRVIHPWTDDRVHATEADAWRDCASFMRQRADAISTLADECLAKAGEGVAA